MTLTEYQHKVCELLSSIRHPRIATALSLAEEAGEVCKEIMEIEVYETHSEKQKLALELADVLISLLETASAYEINLEEAMNTKLKTIESSVPKWKEKFSLLLEKKRNAWDKPIK